MPGTAEDFVVLAVIGRAHGIRGAMRARLFSDSTLLFDTDALYLRRGEEPPERATILSSHPGSRGAVVLQLADVDSRTAAETLVGAALGVMREALPELAPGEFYLTDLPGMEVVDEQGQVVGTVSEVISYPTMDCAAVRRPTGLLEVPLIEPWLVDVDNAARRLVVGDLSDLELPAPPRG